MEYQIKIEFRGVCAHFVGVVPGVPHRVVLPQTTIFYLGQMMTGPEQGPDPVCYTLPPHFSYVMHGDPQDARPIDACPGLDGGWIRTGVRLQIRNAINRELEYPPAASPYGAFFTDVPPLTDFVPDYRYASNVVVGGRAKAYFDVFRGCVQTVKCGDAIHTVVTMTTDGPPILQITPMAPSDTPGEPHFVDAPVTSPLHVGNSASTCIEARYDFLWHYLTNQTDIPLHFHNSPPGLDAAAACPPETMTDHFTKLLAAGVPDVSPKDMLFVETSASCSNSRYP